MFSIKKEQISFILFFTVAFSYAQDGINMLEIKDQVLMSKMELVTNTAVNQSVYILQMGQNNVNSVTANFNNGSINIIQEGNNNDSSIVRAGETIFENVHQRGDNNLFYDYSVLPTNNVNMNVKQFGSELSIYNSGANSISNSLSITQKGSNQMVIILNN